MPTINPHAPFFIVFNLGSGSEEAAVACATLEAVLREAGREYRLLRVEEPSRLAQVSQEAVALALEHEGVVVAAGGDGTLNTVAQATLGSGRPFGVLPQGTFNYFSRTHGIPSDMAQAVRVLLECQPHPVPVGLVNGQVFLVNASLGLYPELLEEREAYKQRYGRSRQVAWWAGVRTLLRDHSLLNVRLERDGQAEAWRTLTLFVGNNRLQLEQAGLPEADAVESGLLAATVLRPMGALRLLGLVLRGALGRLGEAERVARFTFRDMTVTPLRPLRQRRPVKVAMDGEIHWLTPPLRFQAAPSALPLIKPRLAPGEHPPDPDRA
jgi:diacylglycerol kinase family enzyme